MARGVRRLSEVAALFLKLGVISFGGPAAHIALMEQEAVSRRGWLSREHFLDLLAATNLVPGPDAVEMASHIRFVHAGWPGMVAGVVSFILPAALISLALAWVYVRFLTTHQIEEANLLCDRVAIIDHGRIAAIYTPERLKEAFRRVQSAEVALELAGSAHGEALVAPMSLATLLLGKTLVGALFAVVVSAVSLLISWLGLGVNVAEPVLLAAGVDRAGLAFSAFGLVFASIPTRSVGSIMMPSTLVRWPLLFVSGIFIPWPRWRPGCGRWPTSRP